VATLESDRETGPDADMIDEMFQDGGLIARLRAFLPGLGLHALFTPL